MNCSFFFVSLDSNVIEKPVVHSSEPIPPLNTENDNNRVVFRQKNSILRYRPNVLINPLKENYDNHLSLSLNPSDSTLFYITSSVSDDNSIANSYSFSTSDQPSLSVNNFFNNVFFVFNRKVNVCLNVIYTS